MPVLETELGRFGFWRVSRPHPTDSDWGVFEDEVGVGIYYVHRLDSSLVWFNGNTEVPGVDSGNPIHYPTWYRPGDGSEMQGALEEMRGRGTLAFGFWFEMSTTPLSGPPERIWPKVGNWWEPLGHACQPELSGRHAVIVD